MKILWLKPSMWIGMCVATCLIIVACKKNDASNQLSPETVPLSRLDWNLKTLVDAYQKAGYTNPKWDDSAKRALTELARIRSQTTTSNETWVLIISNNCAAAVDAGCDDPMIRYLYLRYCTSGSGSKKAIADAYCKAAQDLEKSSYPNIRKYYACERAAQALASAFGYGTNMPPEYKRMGIWGNSATNLLNALSDRTIPPEEFYDASHEMLEEYKGSKKQYSDMYHCMEDRFPNDWKTDTSILLLKGEAYIQMGWHARGGSYADKVTSEGWKLFGERLAVAESALTKAWQLNTNDPRIAVTMMKLELGQGQGRDRMELWFQRAMALDPNDYDACNSKLWYLEPKWYGSVNDMLAFGRECVQNKKWGGHVPLILLDAHVAIHQEFTEASGKTNYWKQPAVWLDLKSAFERFFELNPDAIGWYHNYARYAYQAGDWAAFNKLIPKLGPINYDFFGGKNEFEKMLAMAKERADKQADSR
jgi:hypothetical protein